jgi:hypothetical protein
LWNANWPNIHEIVDSPPESQDRHVKVIKLLAKLKIRMHEDFIEIFRLSHHHRIVCPDFSVNQPPKTRIFVA